MFDFPHILSSHFPAPEISMGDFPAIDVQGPIARTPWAWRPRSAPVAAAIERHLDGGFPQGEGIWGVEPCDHEIYQKSSGLSRVHKIERVSLCMYIYIYDIYVYIYINTHVVHTVYTLFAASLRKVWLRVVLNKLICSPKVSKSKGTAGNRWSYHPNIQYPQQGIPNGWKKKTHQAFWGISHEGLGWQHIPMLCSWQLHF